MLLVISFVQEFKNLGEVSLYGNGLVVCGEDVFNEFL